MNKLDKEYQMLLEYILGNGVEKKDRTGTGTLSVFGWQMRHNMKDGFPLLTTKKMYFKGIVTELLWFLRGDTSIKYLLENDCNIWTGDAFRNYWECNKIQSNPKWLKPVTYSNGNVGAKLYNIEEFINKIKTDDEFAKKWGELGPIYGKQWRSWQDDFGPNKLPIFPPNNKIDQIANLINDLKTNPDSRRLMVNAWNVGELDQCVLPPCHYGFQVYTRELSLEERIRMYALKEGQTYEQFVTNWDTEEQWLEDLSDTTIPTRAISLMWNQRSVDVPLGLPFNIASYGLLLEIIAKTVNMIPDELIGNLGDCHIYLNQIDGVKEQLTRESYPLPQLLGKDEYHYLMDQDMPFSDKIDQFKPDFWKLENYQSHPSIKIPLSN
jgi:thymidylate synthase